MRKVYYRYNPQSLSYERVYPSWKQRIWAVCRHLITGVVIGGGIFAIATYALGSPMEMRLRKDYRLLLAQYEVLSRRMDEAQEVMDDLQQRDDNLYRAIFQSDPIPASIRKPEYGESNRYEKLMHMPNSELLIEISKKVDILSKGLYVQSNSYDEIAELIRTQEDRLSCIPAIQPVSNKDLKMMASGFGTRIDPIYKTPRFHAGMDFTAKTGTEIYSTGNGIISFAKWNSGYGNCVIINHGYGYETLYGHCEKILVNEGQTVKRGEIIATVGNTGKSTGPHLHYEVIFKGKPDNPAKYYFMDLSPEEYARMLQIAENHGQVMD